MPSGRIRRDSARVWRFLKLLFWIIPPLLLAGAGSLFLWYKRDVYQRDQRLGADLKELRTAKPVKYDFGLEKFDKAVALLRDGKDEEARRALLEMLRTYGDSARALDAMRLIGQMNLDRLFAPEPGYPGKIQVEVGRGESLNKLAATYSSSYQYLVRVNGLTKPEAIQPNDRLWVCPLNLRALVSLKQKQLVLMDGDLFFAVFPILEIRRPPGSKLPVQAEIGNKFGVLDGKRVQLTGEDATRAEKWIEIGKDMAIRSVARGSTAGPGFGIFLNEADADDLAAVLRQGNRVQINP